LKWRLLLLLLLRGAAMALAAASATGGGESAAALERELLPVLREGFLHKRKQKGLRMGVFATWQRRYCVLDNVAKCLSYGPAEAAQERREVAFHEIRRVFLSKAPPADGVDEAGGQLRGGSEFCVELVHYAANGNGSRVFTFRAQDPHDAQAWVDAIHPVSILGRGQRRLSRVMLNKIERYNAGRAPSPSSRRALPKVHSIGSDQPIAIPAAPAADEDSPIPTTADAEGVVLPDAAMRGRPSVERPPLAPLEIESPGAESSSSPGRPGPRSEADRLRALTQRVLARAAERKKQQNALAATHREARAQRSGVRGGASRCWPRAPRRLLRGCAPCLFVCFKSNPEMDPGDVDGTGTPRGNLAPTAF